jgi:hypothetical protein
MGRLSLQGMWLFLALVISASVVLAVGSVWLANRPGSKEQTGSRRILDAKPRIPGLLWSGLLFGGVLLIGLIGFSRLSSRRVHMILASAVAILLGLLLFLIYWLDHPFGRQLGVTPTLFDYSTQVFDGVDQGT